MPFGAGRLRLVHGIGERLDVLNERSLRERRLADAGLHDAGLLDPEFDRTALGALYRIGDVHGHGADLRVRHHAARAEHLTETADQRHHVGGCDTAVEIDLAFVDLFDEVFRADNIGTGGLRLFRLGAACEHADAHGAPGTVRQIDHAADHLVGVTRIDAEI